MIPICVLLLTVGQLGAESSTLAVKRGIESASARRQQRLQEVKAEIAKTKRGYVLDSKRDRARFELQKARADARKRAGKKTNTEPPTTFETREKKEARLAKLQDAREVLLDVPAFPLASRQPSTGDLGRLGQENFRVLQIAGPLDVLGQISWHHGREMKIDGLTQDTPITTVRTKPFEIWLTGVDTSEMKAGEISIVKEPIVVLGERKQVRGAQGAVYSVPTGRPLTKIELQRVTADESLSNPK